MRVNIHSPLGLGLMIKTHNRLVVPAMASGTATVEGFATQATVDHYERLARSGAGIVFVEYTFVHASGRSEEHQLGADSDAHSEGLAKIAKVIAKQGALPALQLTHAGGKSERAIAGGMLQSPSGIAVPVKGKTLETPDVMTFDDIRLWKYSFLQAARRAWAAGFKIVELHSAHGYGLNQWLSPLTNLRNDCYGGNLLGRTRLLDEIVQEIKKQVPELTLSVRMPGQDHLEGGLSLADSLEIAQLLASHGVDMVNVSSGIGGWRRPEHRTGEGYLVDEAAFLQSQLNVPVIGVGGIVSAAYIDAALQSGKFSLAAVGRAILSDPDAWRELNLRPDPVHCSWPDIVQKNIP